MTKSGQHRGILQLTGEQSECKGRNDIDEGTYIAQKEESIEEAVIGR